MSKKETEAATQTQLSLFQAFVLRHNLQFNSSIGSYHQRKAKFYENLNAGLPLHPIVNDIENNYSFNSDLLEIEEPLPQLDVPQLASSTDKSEASESWFLS